MEVKDAESCPIKFIPEGKGKTNHQGSEIRLLRQSQEGRGCRQTSYVLEAGDQGCKRNRGVGELERDLGKIHLETSNIPRF